MQPVSPNKQKVSREALTAPRTCQASPQPRPGEASRTAQALLGSRLNLPLPSPCPSILTHLPAAHLLGLLPSTLTAQASSLPLGTSGRGSWAAHRPCSTWEPAGGPLARHCSPTEKRQQTKDVRACLPPSLPCCTSGGGRKESKETWGERWEVNTRFAFLWSIPPFALTHVSWPPEVFIPVPLCLQLTRLETDHSTSQEQ